MTENPQKILVIKLSALGDVILALPAMAAIRAKHPHAHITLLTTKPFVDIAAKSRYFNDIWVDERKPLYDPGYLFGMARRLNKEKFDFVYDLQLNKRSAAYFRLMRKKPGWSGVARGASHRYAHKDWRAMHAYDRHKAILKLAGIDVEIPDLSWMDTDVSSFGLQNPYALLVPGSSPRHPEKRWPVMKYLSVASRLMREGYDVAVIGGKAEQDIIDKIVKLSPRVRDLSGRTTLFDLAALAKGAAYAVGNDTGPTHLIAMNGCPTLALFSGASDPAKSAPVGRKVTVIQSDPIDGITVDDVMQQVLS